MAHGLESRVPFLDHPLVELAATMPADVKFKDGDDEARASSARSATVLPDAIVERKDKMGFPVPLQEWLDRAGRGARLRARHALVGRRARPRARRQRQGAGRARDRAPLRPQGLGAAVASSSGSRRSTTAADELPQATPRTRRGHSYEGSDHRRRRLHRLAPRRPPARARRRGRSSSTTSRPARRDNLTPHAQLHRRRGHRSPTRTSSTRPSTASGPDVVVHAAAAYKDPDDWDEDAPTNVARHGERRQGAAGCRRRAGSSTSRRRSATALQPLEQPITLDHPLRPEGSSYAISQDRAASSTSRLSDLDWVSFRLANAYGPRNISAARCRRSSSA